MRLCALSEARGMGYKSEMASNFDFLSIYWPDIAQIGKTANCISMPTPTLVYTRLDCW